MRTIIKITKIPQKLLLVKAIKDVTKKPLLEIKNIIDLSEKNGFQITLNINESSITSQQWEEIAKNCPSIEWEEV